MAKCAMFVELVRRMGTAGGKKKRRRGAYWTIVSQDEGKGIAAELFMAE